VVRGSGNPLDAAEKEIRLEKRFLQGGSLFELLIFPIIVIICSVLLFNSIIDDDIDYVLLIVIAVGIFAILFEIPKTYHVIIEMNGSSITEMKRSKKKTIQFDSTAVASIDTARRRADPSRRIVKGITLSDEEESIECLEMEGWKPKDIQDLWDLLLVVIDEGGVRMSKSMETFYYSIEDPSHVT
jgi:hypothetical protein